MPALPLTVILSFIVCEVNKHHEAESASCTICIDIYSYIYSTCGILRLVRKDLVLFKSLRALSANSSGGE